MCTVRASSQVGALADGDDVMAALAQLSGDLGGEGSSSSSFKQRSLPGIDPEIRRGIRDRSAVVLGGHDDLPHVEAADVMAGGLEPPAITSSVRA